MIPKKYYGLVLSGALSIMMGLLMSGVVTAINTGFDSGYVERWLDAFLLVVPIAFVSLQFLRPLATAIADTLTKQNK